MTSSTKIILATATELQPAPLFTPTQKVAKRVPEFFTAQINNDHTRKAYLNATRRFAEWCDARGIGQLADVQAFHVGAFVKELQGEFSPPTVKQHLAALAHAVRLAGDEVWQRFAGKWAISIRQPLKCTRTLKS
jgi:hypothetical protein